MKPSSRLKLSSGCGQIYGSKVWHSNDPYRKVIWRCNDKYSGGKKCSTPTLTEIEIKAAFERVLEKMSSDKPEIIKNLKEILAALDPTELLVQKENWKGRGIRSPCLSRMPLT